MVRLWGSGNTVRACYIVAWARSSPSHLWARWCSIVGGTLCYQSIADAVAIANAVVAPT